MSTLWLSVILVFASMTSLLAETTEATPPKKWPDKARYPYVIPGCSHIMYCPWLPLGPPMRMDRNGVDRCFRRKKCRDDRDCNYHEDEICRDGSCMQLFCKKILCRDDFECRQRYEGTEYYTAEQSQAWRNSVCEAGICGNVNSS